MKSPFTVRDLGAGVSHAEAFAIQQAASEALQAGAGPETVFLVEHAPVITLTAKLSARANLITPPEELARLGVAVEETNRGGDITYHGPGQLVAYPILDLNRHGLNLSSYMRLLEEVVIATLAHFGVAGQREAGATGVWTRGRGHSCPRMEGMAPCRGQECPRSLAKICAMGVRIRKGTTLHGLALNVTTDMSHFGLIVPCGLAGRPVTSLAQLLGDACPPMAQVKAQLIAELGENLGKSKC